MIPGAHGRPDRLNPAAVAYARRRFQQAVKLGYAQPGAMQGGLINGEDPTAWWRKFSTGANAEGMDQQMQMKRQHPRMAAVQAALSAQQEPDYQYQPVNELSQMVQGIGAQAAPAPAGQEESLRQLYETLVARKQQQFDPRAVLSRVAGRRMGAPMRPVRRPIGGAEM